MIDAHVWTTPNGFKALIALEELGLPYTPRWVDITSGAQHRPEYLAINPNNKIPAIIDHDADGGPLTVFESGAVLWYLAHKTGRFLPADERGRLVVLEWLFWSAGGLGPMAGQVGYWRKFAKEPNPVAQERYEKEVERLFGVLERRLTESPFIAGADYTVADMMSFTWARATKNFIGMDMSAYPKTLAWIGTIEVRPAVAKALAMKPPAKE